MVQTITFRYYCCVNGGRGVDIYPAIWTKDHDGAWDGRDNSGTYWLVSEGQSKTVDLKHDLDRDGHVIGGGKVKIGGEYVLGADVVWGDDVWLPAKDYVFVYDPNSDQQVTVRKYGGERDGDASFDGVKSKS